VNEPFETERKRVENECGWVKQVRVGVDVRICKTHELITQLCSKLQIAEWWGSIAYLRVPGPGLFRIQNGNGRLVPKGKVSLESPLHYDSMSTPLSIHSFIL